jgi:hypothetical protein
VTGKAGSNAFRESGSALVVSAPYVEVYIPKEYFREGIASQVGDKVSTLCIFEFEVFSSEDSKSGIRKVMGLPLVQTIGYSSTYEKGEGEEKVVVLQLREGDIFMESLDVVMDAASTKAFVRLLHSGHIPPGLPYESVLKAYVDNLEINGVDLEVPYVVLEVIIAEIYRDASDINVPFRKVAGSKDKTASPLNLKRLAMVSSTFAAASFENMGQAIITSVGRGRKGAKDAVSPVEKSIHY